ncbi:7996_t:CDS:2 [Funneliformis mosseae]|uniref:7996_t:CDS:1 n=1 Tax=Funneliformis mosseae TaxID=27381 RepID=A0A9N8W9M0_FUNMO|nr:7996_t:CDS:2 [Funneliformis mosseae]
MSVSLLGRKFGSPNVLIEECVSVNPIDKQGLNVIRVWIMHYPTFA